MSKFILIVIFFTTITSCASRKPHDKDKALLHLKIGTGYLSKGNYPQALDELLLAESLDSENSTIQNNLGIAYFVRQKYSEAESHLKQALRLNPKYTEARNNLGRTLIKLGLFEVAIKELKIAAEDLTYQYPERSYSNLGIAYFNNKQYQDASQFLKKSLKLRPHHCESSYLFARSLFERQKYQPAILAFDQAAKDCPSSEIESESILYYSAMASFKLNLSEEAIARFEEIVVKYPKGSYLKQSKKMLSLLKR